MSEGDHEVNVQQKRGENEAAAQRESADVDEKPSRTRFTGGAIPPVAAGFAEAKPAASEMAFGPQDVAATGVAGSGGALPHAAQISASFGRHAAALDGVQAHVGGKAEAAARALGAQAYATGSSVAFGSSPDLHTAAHEAAHVVQQKGGVQLKSGVGKAGDSYEQNADAVADRVVQGKSAEDLLDPVAGNGKAGGSQAVQFLGQSLDQPLAAGQEAPKYGEDAGEQRRWSPDQYIAMWEKEQGRKITPEERETLDRGCIGVTAMNLHGGGNPLESAEKSYASFDQAHAAMVERNKMLDQMAASGKPVGKARYVLFAQQFWSNQSKNWKDRLKPDPKAFRPNPKTGEIDMSGYDYEPQSKYDVDENGKQVESSYVNFDYGFWDDSSQTFWHANHMDYHDANDPMKVFQSSKEHFIAGYRDFDRVVFCIAKAENYDPGLAAISHARSGGSR